MSTFERIGKAVDRVVGIFSPFREYRRTVYRRGVSGLRSREMYAAAKTNNMTGAWHPVDSNVNSIIGASNPFIKSRVSQLVRDFPYFSRGVNILVDKTVGDGMIFQSKIKDQSGKLVKALNTAVEDGFKRWADEADVAGQLHYYDMMRLAKRQDVERGEFLLVKTQINEPKRYSPFALQIYEADWLTTQADTYSGGRIGLTENPGAEIYQGIEFDRRTGRRIAYHFVDPDGWGTVKRVLAEDVIHGLETLRPGQLRGVSPFAPAVILADILRDFILSELDGARKAAKWLAMVETGDPVLFQEMRDATAGLDYPTKKIEELENSIIEYLRPGEKMNLASSDRPGDAFEPFVALLCRMMAITVNVPYEFFAGDFRGISYSNHKGIRNDFSEHLRPICTRHVRQFCNPSWKPALDWIVMKGKLSLSDYFSNPFFYLQHTWMPPKMAPIDPLKEGRANSDAVDALLKSPQAIMLEEGRDIEDVYGEIAEAQQMRKDLKIEPQEVSNSTAGNPASLMAEDDRNSSEFDRRAFLSIA